MVGELFVSSWIARGARKTPDSTHPLKQNTSHSRLKEKLRFRIWSNKFDDDDFEHILLLFNMDRKEKQHVSKTFHHSVADYVVLWWVQTRCAFLPSSQRQRKLHKDFAVIWFNEAFWFLGRYDFCRLALAQSSMFFISRQLSQNKRQQYPIRILFFSCLTQQWLRAFDTASEKMKLIKGHLELSLVHTNDGHEKNYTKKKNWRCKEKNKYWSILAFLRNTHIEKLSKEGKFSNFRNKQRERKKQNCGAQLETNESTKKVADTWRQKFESNLGMPCGKATHFSSIHENEIRVPCPQRVIKKLNYLERHRWRNNTFTKFKGRFMKSFFLFLKALRVKCHGLEDEMSFCKIVSLFGKWG